MSPQRYVVKNQKLFWLLTGWFMAGLVQANQDIEGAEDLGFIERFPQSWIVDYSQQQVPDYSLATGRIKKINGVISPQSQQYLAGRLTRITYQVPSSRGSRQVLEYFERQFEELQAEQLFSCDGRNCGESNQWANIQLKIAKLYGVDREQYYRALKLNAPSGQKGERYLAFYTVKRGNKRVYAQLDLLEAGPVAAAVSANNELAPIDLLGRQPVYRLADNLGAEDVAYLNRLLAKQLSVQLVLVGHSQLGETLVEQQQQAKKLAEGLQQRLVDGGIKPERIVTQSVGGLAPSYDQSIPAERVELQLHPVGYIE